MKNLLFMLLVGFSLLSISACENIVGEGPIVTQELELEGFNEFSLNGSFDVEVNYGETQKVEAVGQQNIIDRLNSYVENDFWEIKLAKGNYKNYDLVVKITLPSVNKAVISGSGDMRIFSMKTNDVTLEINGSGDMVVNKFIENLGKAHLKINGSGSMDLANLETSQLTSKIQGSGNITVWGTVDDHSVVIEGSGKIRSYGLQCDVCSVFIEGSGDLFVTVNETLEVEVNGSGNVNYKGNPEISSKISGSGKIMNRN